MFRAWLHVILKHTYTNTHILTKKNAHGRTCSCKQHPFLISESCVPARHAHILLTHNVDWSHCLSNCNNQVIHSRLFPAYYSFSRLLSQSCAEVQEVIVLWMSFYSNCKGRDWLNARGWCKNGCVGLRKDGFIGLKCFEFIVQQHVMQHVNMFVRSLQTHRWLVWA